VLARFTPDEQDVLGDLLGRLADPAMPATPGGCGQGV
jgi:hypothetical protein